MFHVPPREGGRKEQRERGRMRGKQENNGGRLEAREEVIKGGKKGRTEERSKGWGRGREVEKNRGSEEARRERGFDHHRNHLGHHLSNTLATT